jgi:hypothetical protein
MSDPERLREPLPRWADKELRAQDATIREMRERCREVALVLRGMCKPAKRRGRQRVVTTVQHVETMADKLEEGL